MEEKNKKPQEHRGGFGPDPETLHSTDPQEHMHGPLSDRLHKISDAAKKPSNAEPQYRDERERDGDNPWEDR
ncbi:hypothetical protein EPD60_12355 [Flaviaesturariibacter flavus]|uniref:Uncharacterized protein n=1 Tax=Flaviaesturariibacter flavus TaxID=2502780 RepID=A0A4R1B9K4_9BACT|nr:hypothetical protein [Flaviaesturariibacter flavus]TCJ13583.1 hypothetical protein EPD60_12355 [Flaviaesturariibacter flavus]